MSDFHIVLIFTHFNEYYTQIVAVFHETDAEQKQKQMCCKPTVITVGCVPSPTVAICSWGVSGPGGSATRRVSALGGGCLLPGGCLVPGGCLIPGGCVFSRGCLVPGGCLVLGGAWYGGGIPVCIEADTPVNRMTDRCKNITFATSLWTVITVATTHLQYPYNS